MWKSIWKKRHLKRCEEHIFPKGMETGAVEKGRRRQIAPGDALKLRIRARHLDVELDRWMKDTHEEQESVFGRSSSWLLVQTYPHRSER
jgi:hypothetical protein